MFCDVSLTVYYRGINYEALFKKNNSRRVTDGRCIVRSRVGDLALGETKPEAGAGGAADKGGCRPGAGNAGWSLSSAQLGLVSCRLVSLSLPSSNRTARLPAWLIPRRRGRG